MEAGGEGGWEVWVVALAWSCFPGLASLSMQNPSPGTASSSAKSFFGGGGIDFSWNGLKIDPERSFGHVRGGVVGGKGPTHHRDLN